MPVCHASLNTVTQVTSDAAWTVSKNKRFRANIIVWGMPKSLSTLEIRTKLADLGLVGFARGAVAWEGDHVRLVLLPKQGRIQGGCFGCSSTPLNDRIHSFVSAMARILYTGRSRHRRP